MLNLGNTRGEKIVTWIDRRFYNNKLDEKLKNQKTRRAIAKVGFIVPIAFGYMLGYTAWSFMAPNSVTILEKFLGIMFWVSMFSLFIIPTLVQRSLQSVLQVPGQPFDERQQLMNTKAESDAYPIVVGLLLLGMLVGVGMLIAVAAGYFPWEKPYYGGIHYLVGLTGTLFVFAKLLPFLLLAWQLPDEVTE